MIRNPSAGVGVWWWPKVDPLADFVPPLRQELRHLHPLCGGTWRHTPWGELVCDDCQARAVATVANLDEAWTQQTRKAVPA